MISQKNFPCTKLNHLVKICFFFSTLARYLVLSVSCLLFIDFKLEIYRVISDYIRAVRFLESNLSVFIKTLFRWKSCLKQEVL